MPIDALSVLCAQLTRDLLAIAKFLFPTIHFLLKVLATLPVSTATAERTFSTLKRLKTYWRNATGQDRLRLTGLALMSVHRDIGVNVQRVIDELSKKPRRLNFVL